MITETDSLNTIDLGRYYAILPSVSFNHPVEDYLKHHNAKFVEKGFSYNSGKNTQWVNVEEMRELIKQFVDPDFQPLRKFVLHDQ
jgi:hypothetical protein